MLDFWRQLVGGVHRAKHQRPLRSRPELEPIEGRILLSTAVPHLVHHPAHVRHAPTIDPLTRYSVFQATIVRGPQAGLVLEGPLVLGYSGRIQVMGEFFPKGGTPILVVGTVFGGGVDLRFVLPGPRGTGALEVAGAGSLRQVPNGLPDGLALIGSGNVSGPASNDVGHWIMLRPNVPR